MKLRCKPISVASILLILSLVDGLAAQQTSIGNRSSSAISGVVIDTNGTPVSAATVVALRSGQQTHTDSTGHFLLAGIRTDTATISVRHIGFRQKVQMASASSSPVTVVLILLPSQLESVVVSAQRDGVFGRVLDMNDDPVPGASIQGSGDRGIAITDFAGRFALPHLAPGGHLIDIRRLGFLPARLSLRVGHDSGRNVTIHLKQLPSELSAAQMTALSGLGPPTVQEAEFARRQVWHSYNSDLISRDELERYGNASLESVIQHVPSIVEKSLRVPANVCIFVNGIASPSATLNSFKAAEIEAIEVVGNNGDYTGTLASRWPHGAVCGDPAYRSRGGGNIGQNDATYVNVLLRGE